MKSSTIKAGVICNPLSGGGSCDPEEVRRELQEDYEVEWLDTGSAGEVEEAARGWTSGLLITAGGDGTITRVVNGLGRAGFPEGVTLAVLPTGTGNDLAATLAIPEDREAAREAIRAGRTRKLDVVRVRPRGAGEQFLINVATGGLGAETSKVIDGEMKSRWGKLTYLRASLEAAQNFDVREATLTLDGVERRLRAVNMAVGNCRYAGGGWPAAPRANPEDGLIDLVVIEDLGAAELLSLAPPIFARSDYLDREGVFFARAKEIRIDTVPPGLHFTVDGEVIGDEPAEFSIIPQALKVIVGPEYTPEPEERA